MKEAMSVVSVLQESDPMREMEILLSNTDTVIEENKELTYRDRKSVV